MQMKTKSFFLLCCLLFVSLVIYAERPLTVRGLCLGAPAKDDVPAFVKLIDEKLAPDSVNTLVLRIDYRYEYKSHPELRADNPLSEADVKKIVAACKRHNIRVIPQVNLLGHQSWASQTGKLLEVYPQFDETPSIKLPKDYKWPNADGLYCKSYCPQHPEVHDVVFEVVDEIVQAFESDAFHAGMDEVFYIAHPDCPRCKGEDPAVLFAGEVTKIRNHLADNGKELWIWGDRLIDGKTTGIGLWEGSYNNTHRAIDLIPKDVVINDWHYEKPHPTPVLFAAKGFDVIICPWRIPDVAVKEAAMMKMLRENASDEMRPRYAGIMHTFWSDARTFIDGMNNTTEKGKNDPSVQTFKELVKVW